jgi:hypothetical protein
LADTQTVRSPRAAAQGRLRPNWRLLRLLGLAIACAAALLALLTAPVFQASAAQVRGNQRVPAEVIRAAAGVEQRNVFAIQPQRAASRIEALPGVAAAEVHVRLPDQVLVDVREHTPFVAWQAVTTTIWLAEDATALPAVGDPPALSLVDEAGAAGDPGGRLRPQVLADLKALRAARPDLTRLYYGAAEGLYFRSPENWTVYLGSQGDIAAKLALLQAVRREVAPKLGNLEIVDLRFEGRALVR